MEKISRVDDDPNSITTFNFIPEGDEEGLISKIFSKFKTAVVVSNQPSPNVSIIISNEHDTLLETDSLPNVDHHHHQQQQQQVSNTTIVSSRITDTNVSSMAAIITTATTSAAATTTVLMDPSPNNSVATAAAKTESITTNSIMIPLTKTASIDSSDNQSIITTFSVSNTNSLSRILNRLRKSESIDNSNKEFWMPDEQCKECNNCKSPFNLFRRKHHCRTCGHIFCSKCLSNNIHTSQSLRVCDNCFSKYHADDTNNSLHDTYPYSSSVAVGDSSSLTSLSMLQPVTSQQPQKTFLIPTDDDSTDDDDDNDHSGNMDSSRDLNNTLDHGMANNSNFDLQQQRTSMELYNGDNATATAATDLGIKKLLTSTFLRTSTPRSRTSTMNSLGIDTSMAALEGTRQSQRLLSSPMPFRRTSSIFNSQSVSNLHPDSAPVTHTSSSGHGTPTHSSDYYGGEDDDLKRWERNSRNLLNFLSGGGGGGGGGHGERPNSGIFNNIPFLDDITTSYHGGGGGDSPTNNHSTPITNTKGTSWFMMRPERSNSIIRRRLSLTENSTSTTRHVRVRTKSLMRNTPMMAMTDSADQQDNLATNGKMMPSHSTPTPTRRSITPEQRIQTQQQQHEQNQSQSQPQQPQQLQLQPQLQQQQQQSSQEQSSHNHSIVKHQDWDPSFLKFMRDILRHLLDTGDLNRDDWEEMMMHLLLTIIDEVQPQLRIRDTFNMNHYVKIKKVPGGVPSDSFSVSGVVLSKTVAHKGMMRTIRQPTILILNFDLDGTVTATESQPQEYLKFERLLVWERDHMRALVSEIIQLKPHIVLVASQVPRTLIEHLNKAGIVVAYHVKRTKLEAIARCTDATVFNYKNELWNAKTISPGKCGLFEPLTVMHEYLPNRRKTFLMFRECPKERGATIVLRGGDLKTLTTAKFIMNFMVTVANNIHLEAQLRRDFRELRCWSRSTLAIDDQLGEGSDAEQQQQIIDLIGEQPNNTVSNSVRPATLVASSYHGEGSLASDAPPLDTLSVSALSVAESQVTVNTVDKRRTPGQQQQQQQYYQQTTIMFVDDDDICLTAVNSVLRQYQTTTLSMSPGVSLPVPHLLLKLRETQKRLIGLIRERLGPNITGTTTTLQEEDEGEGGENESIDDNTNREADNDDDSSSNHAISPDTSNKASQEEFRAKTSSSPTRSTPVIPPIPTDLMLMQDYLKSFDAYLEHDLEYRHYQDLHLQCWLMYKKYIGSIPLYLSPIYHQQIIVRRTINPMDDHTIPCEKAVLDPYEYYNPTCDCTLGQYILNSVKEAYYKCSSQMCGGPLIFHDRTYSHGNAQIKVQIFVEEDEAEEDMAVMVEEEGERIEISRDEYLRKIPILICTHCNLCNVTHHWKPMSELLQRYSFGKFLELLFYQSEPVSLFSNHDDNEEEIIGCPHGFYRDHSISFRIQNLSVNFTHETVKVVDVYPPPLHLRFSTKQQMAIKDAALESTRTKIARFFDSIIERNKTFSYDIVHPNMLELCKEYLQELSQEALKNKKHLLQKLQMEYATSAPTDTLQLNNVLADLQNHAVAWDLKYIDVARRFIRPERELRRLTTNHLRKMFPAENIYTSNGSSTAETTVSTNLNLRTKRAIEAADLPLLDVGLYDEDYSSATTTVVNAVRSEEVVGLKEQPVLSESPTESYPWFDEVKRFDQMFLHTKESTAQTGGAGSDGCAAAALRAGSDATMSTALGSSPKGNTTPSSLLQQQQQEEDVSRDLDPRVARRLSLELMKDSPNKKKMIVEKKAHQQQQQKQLQQQEKKSQGYLEESKIVETNTPMSSANSTPLPSPMTPNATGQNQSQLIVRNNTPINSILSSTAYKRFAGLLPDPVLDKSKSLPSPGQQKKKKEQSRTHQYRKSHYFEAATGSESETAHMTSSSAITTGQRQDLKSSSTTTQQPLLTQTVIKPNAYRGSPYTAKIQDRSPIAYRYGFMGSLADMYPLGEKRLGVASITHPISSKLAATVHTPKMEAQLQPQEVPIIRPRSRTMAIVDGNNSSSKTTSVLGQQPSGGVNRIGARPISTAGSKEKGYAFTSVLDTSVLEHSRLPVPIRYHRHNLSESNQGSTANNNKMTAVVATATTATTRTIRQRLPSKASLEPYTKIKELTLDDDEASSSDDDDPVMASNETLLGDDEPKVFTFGHRPFSLFYTDEYDECLGREMAPSILELQEFEEEHQVQMTNTTLPFLSLETDMWVENKKEEETSKGTTMIEAAALLRSSASLTLDHGTGSAASFDWTTNGSGRNSIMKAITYVLAEKSINNLAQLEYPFSPNEHIFADSNILVREDEPSSIISYMLGSALYNEKLRRKQELRMSKVSPPSFDNREKMANEKPFFSEMFPETDERERPWRFAFQGGSTNFSCKIYFAEQFDMLRKSCGCDEIFISSLARCTTYDASGGKSGSIFLKTKDERFLIKQISKYEMDAFSGSANKYFVYMFNEVFDKGIPTVLCKIFGLYRIGFYNNVSGKSMKMDILVMENLFYDIPIKQVFDLKGSMRNRYAEKTGKDIEVFLDENLVELISKTPLYMKVDTKYNLSNSLYNDTQFLLSLDVMDYSLLVGFVEDSDEIIVGIVDFIRTFTWDKKLESWVKESGMLGGGKKDPTIVSPKMYRKRFRLAIDLYFCMIPDFWTPI